MDNSDINTKDNSSEMFDCDINPPSANDNIGHISKLGFGGLENKIDINDLATILKAVKHDLVKLGSILLPKYCSIKPCSLHYEMSKALLSKDSLAMVIPRNVGKSVYVQGLMPAWNALFMEYEYIVSFSDSSDKAEQQMKMTHDILKNNPMISPFVDIISATKSRLEYINARGQKVIYKSLGVGQSARGFREEEKRPDLVFIDDVETTEGSRSEVIRGRIRRWFFNDVLPLGEDGMRIFFIGTMLGEKSLLCKLLKKPLRVPPMRVIHRSILDENGESLWPEKWTTDTLSLMRLDALDHGEVEAFDMERLSRMTSPETAMFSPSSIVYYNDDMFRSAGDMKSISVVDLGIKEGFDNDPTIIITAAKDGRGNIWVQDIVAVTNQRTENIIRNIISNDRRMMPSCTFIEDVGGQEFLINSIEDNAFGHDYVRIMRISDVSEDAKRFMRTNKHVRISRLESLFKHKKILFPSHCPQIERLINEMNVFTMNGTKGHDDCLDVLAYIDFILERGYSNQMSEYDMAGISEGLL